MRPYKGRMLLMENVFKYGEYELDINGWNKRME